MLGLFNFVILLVVFFPWIVFSGLLALLGLWLKGCDSKVTKHKARSATTVCGVLYEKGYLSLDEYFFETDVVATQFSEDVFEGYLFVVRPITFILQRFGLLDNMVWSVVQRWILVQKDKINNTNFAFQLEHKLADVGVTIARNIGCFLSSI